MIITPKQGSLKETYNSNSTINPTNIPTTNQTIK